ncbi:MAG: MBG domain-containing protein, partial [Clostridia bacterium]|nr:MBG domain-containing protein [Clostridia bacterium]
EAIIGELENKILTGSPTEFTFETTLKLKNNQSVVFYNLGYGSSYEITEAGAEGYVASVGDKHGAAGAGLTVSGTLEGEDAEVAFTNTYQSKELIITADSAEKTYDGTPLTKGSYTSEGLAAGDSIETVTMTGSQTDAGESANVPSEAKIVNSDGKDVTGNYAITYVNGTLKVTPVTDTITVTITEHSGTYTYDGSEQTVTGYDVSTDNELYKEADFTFSGDATVKGTDAGSYEMELKAEDFTNTNPNFVNVKFVIVDGTLEISKRTVTLTSASGTKMFDGTPIRRNNPATHITVGGDGFVSGEGATYTITGVQTDVGQSNNTFTYALNANTKAENYTITQTLGRLMILPEEVPLGLIGSVSLLFMSDTNLTAEGKKADAYKETYKWIKENNLRLGALAIVGTGNAVADRNDEDAWKLIKDELDGLERQPGYLPYYNIAGRNEVNGDEMDYETYLEHKLCEVSEWNEYEKGQIWYQPYNEQQLLLVGIGYQKIADPETATQEELDAQEAWLRYVNNVVARYPDYTVVLLVNDFIEKDPEGRADEGRLTAFGELVEDRIVRINDNIALILCGNAEGTARWDKTYGDRNVNAIMYNYSNDEENGLGFFRIVTLNGEAHTITVTTYSPTLDKDSYDEEHPEYDFYVINDAF